MTSSKLEFGSFKYDPTNAGEFRREINAAGRVVDRANKEIGEAYAAARTFAASLRDRHNVGAAVSSFALLTAESVGPACPDDFRLTVYVPDFLFTDRLFQLAEYYDQKGTRLTSDRAGRTFSERYGIIGRVWRSGVNEVEGQLISDDDRNELPEPHGANEIERLIARRWGLRLDEAVYISRYQSYGAIRIERAGKRLGVLYFDSTRPNAFGNQDRMDNLEKTLAVELERSELVLKMLEISREVAPWSGRIQVFRNS